jgi:eukaryotic-like serine/threonine-protein kinase
MTEQWPSAGVLLAHRYRLSARIEIGGMAAVWRARDELLGRSVALKLLADRYVDEGLHHLVHREARAAAQLSHPHVAAVHDYAEAVAPDGTVRPFVVMELLTGESLATRLTRGPLDWSEAAAIGAATADALAAAHEQGVVHRDVTPGNVMLTPAGVKVVDFGISAAIGEPDEDVTGFTFGTPAYVAPERLDGLPAQAATDVYALGVLLYEMVTGAPPHPADRWEDLPTVRATPAAPLPPHIPAAFATTVWRCLADAPEDRPQAGEVLDALRTLAPAPGSPAGQAAGAPAAQAAGAPAGLTAAGPAAADQPAGGLPSTRPLAGTTADLNRRPDPAVRRNIVIVATAAVLAVAIVILFSALGRQSTPSAVGPTTTPRPGPTATTRPTSSPVPTPSPARSTVASTKPTLGDAVDRLRRSVDAGRTAGDIRPDVAQDLLNIINNLDRNATPARVDALHHKVDDRIREGGISQTRAAQLHSELDQVADRLTTG